MLGRAEGAALDEERAALRAARAAPVVVRSSGATRAPHVPDGGWLTYVDLEIRQGRHHQIRRLCRRAGLKLRHLKRLSVGPVALGSLPPGGVRELGRDEREALYARCCYRSCARRSWSACGRRDDGAGSWRARRRRRADPSAPLVRWRISASSCSAAASDPHE